jgi:hypothetical protein
MERRLALWLRRFSACLARFLAEGVFATVKLLELGYEQIRPRIMQARPMVVKGWCNAATGGVETHLTFVESVADVHRSHVPCFYRSYVSTIMGT